MDAPQGIECQTSWNVPFLPTEGGTFLEHEVESVLTVCCHPFTVKTTSELQNGHEVHVVWPDCYTSQKLCLDSRAEERQSINHKWFGLCFRIWIYESSPVPNMLEPWFNNKRVIFISLNLKMVISLLTLFLITVLRPYVEDGQNM